MPGSTVDGFMPYRDPLVLLMVSSKDATAQLIVSSKDARREQRIPATATVTVSV